MEQAIVLLYWALYIAFLIWLIITLNSINRNTRKTAEYVRQLALCHAPTEDQARVINLALSREEVLDRLAAGGTVVKLDENHNGLEFVNAGAADPELMRQVEANRGEFIGYLWWKKRKDEEEAD